MGFSVAYLMFVWLMATSLHVFACQLRVIVLLDTECPDETIPIILSEPQLVKVARSMVMKIGPVRYKAGS